MPQPKFGRITRSPCAVPRMNAIDSATRSSFRAVAMAPRALTCNGNLKPMPRKSRDELGIFLLVADFQLYFGVARFATKVDGGEHKIVIADWQRCHEPSSQRDGNCKIIGRPTAASRCDDDVWGLAVRDLAVLAGGRAGDGEDPEASETSRCMARLN